MSVLSKSAECSNYDDISSFMEITRQDLRTDATHGRGAQLCAPTNGGSKVNLRKS